MLRLVVNSFRVLPSPFILVLPPGGKVLNRLARAGHLRLSDSTGLGRGAVPSSSRHDEQLIVPAASLLFLEANLRNHKAAEKPLSAESLRPHLHCVVNDLEIQKKKSARKMLL